MKEEFIYSVEDIFTRVPALAGLRGYYIGPYQRGYKWSSCEGGQVRQLLDDVLKAFRSDIPEYYLQYITVLRNREKEAYEVVDGQQRLTTLSIIFQRIAKAEPSQANIAEGKLIYARDENNDGLPEKLARLETAEPLTQDEYYIREAMRCIDDFLKALNDLNDLKDLTAFISYLRHNVKLILNRESDFVNAEEVFINLNDNNVALTDEYLCKGLFLTKNVRRRDSFGNAVDYSNILEQRHVSGRIWDEISYWIKREEVSHYFFGSAFKDGKGAMEQLLRLLYRHHEGKELKGKTNFELFNRFNDLILTEEEGVEWMRRLVHCYKRLRSLYENAQTYNLLGYVLFAGPDNRLKVLNGLLTRGNDSAKSFLSHKVLEFMPKLEKEDEGINYSDKRLTPLLLAFSVFPEGEMPRVRFDFVQYDSKNWTYEHIFPQNPKDGIILLNDVNAMGNMALLTGRHNSALNNKTFAEKRSVLHNKLLEGGFVPAHTVAVFTKSLQHDGFSSDLREWTQADVDAHDEWMRARNRDIVNRLNEMDKEEDSK